MIYQNYKISRVVLDGDDAYIDLTPNTKKLRLKVKGTRNAADAVITLCEWVLDEHNTFSIDDEDNGKKSFSPVSIDCGEVVYDSDGLEVLSVDEVEE
jgi:hypothetical protein